jgi:hypothetical protein
MSTPTATAGHAAALETQAHVAETLGIPLYRAYHLLAASGIRPYAIGAAYFYWQHEIDTWIERQVAQR